MTISHYIEEFLLGGDNQGVVTQIQIYKYISILEIL